MGKESIRWDLLFLFFKSDTWYLVGRSATPDANFIPPATLNTPRRPRTYLDFVIAAGLRTTSRIPLSSNSWQARLRKSDATIAFAGSGGKTSH